MKALILGVTGQDGSYMADLLLSKGYEVHGLIRKSATGNTINIAHILSDKDVFNKQFFLHQGDLADPTSLYRIITDIRPNEIYNEADQDHVRWSYDMVGYSSDITAAAVARILEIIRQVDDSIRYLQPCTSNMFGKVDSETQNESTPFNPQSPYAVAKTFAYYMTRYYRQAYGIHATNVILFNHESPRRPADYVTRKISQSVARISVGKQGELVLGDTSAKIDWGFSGDYVEAEWLALQQDEADDYVIATGKAHSVQEFVDEAFAVGGLDPKKNEKSSKELFEDERMSKSKKNVVDPGQIIETYGADTARLFMLSDSPPNRDLAWTDAGIEGAWRYLNRLWRLVDSSICTSTKKPDLTSLDGDAINVLQLANKTIASISRVLEEFHFNKVIAHLRELTNSIEALKGASLGTTWARQEAVKILIRLLAPILPHLAEEMWSATGNQTLLVETAWPEPDKNLMQDDNVTIAVQVDGKLRGTLHLPKDCKNKDAENAAMALDNVVASVGGKTPQKIIVVPNRIVNIVT